MRPGRIFWRYDRLVSFVKECASVIRFRSIMIFIYTTAQTTYFREQQVILFILVLEFFFH
jgi:hypothetical protein